MGNVVLKSKTDFGVSFYVPQHLGSSLSLSLSHSIHNIVPLFIFIIVFFISVEFRLMLLPVRFALRTEHSFVEFNAVK